MFTWNEEKNQWLKKTRGICFDDVMHAIESGNAIGKINHPNSIDYPHQKILLVVIEEYVYEVPFIPEDNFLKTMYPSRKFTKQFLSK